MRERDVINNRGAALRNPKPLRSGRTFERPRASHFVPPYRIKGTFSLLSFLQRQNEAR